MKNDHPIRRLTVAATAATLVVALAASTARAHGADSGTADIRLGDDTAHVVAWPPSESFRDFDDDGDGRIQRRETRAHREEMLAYFLDHFSLRDEAGRSGEIVFEDLSTPGGGVLPGAGADHLRVTLRLRWETPPRSLRLRYTLPAASPMRVFATRILLADTTVGRKLLAPPRQATFDREHTDQTLLASDAHSSSRDTP